MHLTFKHCFCLLSLPKFSSYICFCKTFGNKWYIFTGKCSFCYPTVLKHWRIHRTKKLLASLIPSFTNGSSRKGHCSFYASSFCHTHTAVLWPCWILSRTTRVSRHQKGKTSLDLLEQEIVSGSGIS